MRVVTIEGKTLAAILEDLKIIICSINNADKIKGSLMLEFEEAKEPEQPKQAGEE